MNAVPGRTLRLLLAPAALLLGAAGTALAQDAGSSPEEEIMKLARKISRELRENEDALAKIARGEKAAPKPVDITLPEKEGEATPPPQGGT